MIVNYITVILINRDINIIIFKFNNYKYINQIYYIITNILIFVIILHYLIGYIVQIIN